MNLRVAVVGLGNIADTAHLPAYRRINGVEVVGISDINSRRARHMAKKWDCEPYDDYRTLLDRAKPDAISVCTPPFARLEIIEYAAENGVHVFCEKPLANSLRVATRIADIVSRHGISFMMGFTLRFMSWYRNLLRRIRQGQLGDPLFLRGVHTSGLPAVPWILDKEKSGGGVLMERGCHAIDLATWLLGEPRRVQAVGFSKREMEVEETALVTLEHESAFSQLAISFGVGKAIDRVEVFGTAATVVVDSQLLTSMFLPASEHILFRYLPEILQNAFRFYTNHLGLGYWENPYEREIAYFIEKLKKGEPPKPDHHSGLTNMRIIDACYQSMKANGRYIHV